MQVMQCPYREKKKKKDNKGEDQEWTDFDVRKELEKSSTHNLQAYF